MTNNMNEAVKVRIKAYGKPAETVYFQKFTKASEEHDYLLGRAVWAGEEIDKEGTLVNRVRIVCEDAIVWQMPVVMNKHHGTFEPKL